MVVARRSDYLPITPRSGPLHLTPWVPDADQPNLLVSITNLKDNGWRLALLFIRLKLVCLS